jgi:hypothetical protein
MKIILYADDKEEMGKNFGKLIQNQFPDIQLDTLNSVSRLSEKLCRPLNRISVIIIFVTCERDIDRLLTLKPLFDNIRLILVLPDRTTGMMAHGLQLNPCFISYFDSDFSDITSVLKKLYTGKRRRWNDR